MATTSRKKSRPGRPLIGLALILLALFGSIFAGTFLTDPESRSSWAPKLALDLEGGTQIILRPVTENNEEVTTEDVNQAIAIIRQRVDSSGVAEAEITSQGGSNIVVALPGTPSEETLDLVRESAQMQFRPVLYFGGPAAIETPEDPAAEDPAAEDPAADVTDDEALPADGATPAPEEAAPTEEPAEEPTTDPFDPLSESPDAPSDPSDIAQVTPELLEEFDALDCTAPENLVGGGASSPTEPLVTCEIDGTAKYILGPMEIAGTDIASASSSLRTNQQGATLNEWAVNIEFNSEGTKKFAETTSRLSTLPSSDMWNPASPVSAPGMFAMVLDNLVISAPNSSVVIPDGKAEITGTFDRESATQLANQLNFGALPLTFEVQSEAQISATLGSEQLEKGLIAGVIGLLLVVVYSLIQYRALGLVTVASLLVAGLITYGLITLLSWTQGYRLSLPGVAGLIVAIGITADSFIVYFERIRDELRDGRSLASAVDIGWERARRTILASDAVNFLAAVVLYFLAVGGVRGFAFTLGLTTLIDILVVFLFTHPLMKLLAKTRFFSSGHPASGLDPRRLGVPGARYAGRGRVTGGLTAGGASADDTAPTAATKKKVLVTAGAPAAGDRQMTIAERRAARLREEQSLAAEQGATEPPAADVDSDERKDGDL